MLSDAAERRDGRPVVAADLRSPEDVAPVAAWLLERLAEHREGALVAADPGPMAPHVHAHAHHH
jgi:urease accessory protein